MTEARQLVERMEHAYQRGDQRQARQDAQELARNSAASPDERARSQAMLERLEPDAFLLIVGALGLGATVWLVYNYVL